MFCFLFFALKKLIYNDAINNIQMNFAGKFCHEFSEGILNNDLAEFMVMQNFVPHQDSTQILQSSDALLLVIDNVPNNKGFLTGKLFEYLGCRKPIFAVGPLDGDAHNIIKEADSGAMIKYDDNEGAYELLKTMYNNWKNNNSIYKLDVENYTRKKLTKKLSNSFEEIIK